MTAPTRPVIDLGGGGHGTVVLAALRAMGSTVLGICDPALPEGGQSSSGMRVLGGDDAVFNYPVGEVLLANGVGSIGNPRKRIAVYSKFRQRGYRFITVTHSAAIVVDDVFRKEDLDAFFEELFDGPHNSAEIR